MNEIERKIERDILSLFEDFRCDGIKGDYVYLKDIVKPLVLFILTNYQPKTTSTDINITELQVFLHRVIDNERKIDADGLQDYRVGHAEAGYVKDLLEIIEPHLSNKSELKKEAVKYARLKDFAMFYTELTEDEFDLRFEQHLSSNEKEVSGKGEE